eukprot:7873015-Lingulodinium_polyedra.AAC.1
MLVPVKRSPSTSRSFELQLELVHVGVLFEYRNRSGRDRVGSEQTVPVFCETRTTQVGATD